MPQGFKIRNEIGKVVKRPIPGKVYGAKITEVRPMKGSKVGIIFVWSIFARKLRRAKKT